MTKTKIFSILFALMFLTGCDTGIKIQETNGISYKWDTSTIKIIDHKDPRFIILKLGGTEYTLEKENIRKQLKLTK